MKKYMFVAAGVFQFICVFAGAAVTLILAAAGKVLRPTSGTQIYSIVVLIMLAFIVVIEIGSMLKIHDSTVHTVLTAGSLLLCYVFSYDMQEIINPSHSATLALATEYIEFISFHLVLLTHLFLLNFLYKAGLNGKRRIAIVLFAILDCVLFALLKDTGGAWIAYIAYFAVLLYLIMRTIIYVAVKKKYDLTFIITASIIFASVGVQLNASLFSTELHLNRLYGIDTTYVLVINLLYVCVYVAFMLRTERQALEATQYRLEAERMKSKLLREQVNPHFIFNSLITVKEAYHSDTERGDEAMNYFSRHLRANVNAMNLDLIPFSEEIDNIENYVGLINMKRQKPVNVIYNIECDDFYVPVLALQVFIENAIKYARTDEIEDGYISLSSYKCEEGVAVEIADNGVGFDVNNIKEGSCGIRNAKERFKLLMGTDVDITSAAGQGTLVKIIIPENGGAKILRGGG